MAEAFGIAASVSGIVSLGLELSTRIITYIDAVKHYNEEISAIHRQTKNLQSSLDILRNAIPDLTSKHQTTGNTVLVALNSVEQDLEALKDFVESLTSSAGRLRNLKSNVKNARKKITFPFHRGNLDALQQRLSRANVSLDTATRTLGLAIISSIDQSSDNALNQLSSLHITSTDNSAISSSIKASLDTFQPQVNEALLEIKTSLNTNFPNIQQGFTSMFTTMLKQEENLTRRIHEARAEFREGRSQTTHQGNSQNSVMSSPDINSEANWVLLKPDLLGGAIGLSDILNDLAEQKDNDPPRLLNATPEQRALYRLVTSPAQLEKIYTLYREKDDVEQEFAIEQRDILKLGFKGYLMDHSLATKEYAPSCICRQHRESLRKQIKLGGLSVNMLSSICQKHLPECRYANSEIVSRSNSLCLSYNGLRWLLSKAADISISFSTGPGGLRISPNIAIRPTVDETQAPVFQSLALLHVALLQYSPDGPEGKTTMLQLLEAVVHRIVQQYRSRRSSPYEVNSQGQSVLHGWVDFLCFAEYLWGDGEKFTALTKVLLEAGSPVSLCDNQGASPGTRLLKRNWNSVFALKRLMCILCEEAPEASIFKNYKVDSCRWLDLFKAFLALRNTTEAIEILGCGPLTSVVLFGNYAEVEKIIALYPSTLYERNLMHQTPFHLAIDKPKILRLLIAAASSQDLDRPDSAGEYTLDYAMRLTPSLCSKGSSWVACSNCSCTESVEILIDFGWRCKFDFLRYCDSDVSHTARLKIIDRLVSQRAVLKALGQQFLPSADAGRHCLDQPTVLDYHAHRVSELLLRHGISIPASVRATLLPQFGCYGCIWHSNHVRNPDPTPYISVYHSLSEWDRSVRTEPISRLAEFLYNKGFRDIDQVNTVGFSPLSLYIYRCYFFHLYQPSYVMWLIDHGANILQPLPVSESKDSRGNSYSTSTTAQFAINYNTMHSTKFPGNECDHGSAEVQHHEVESYRQLVSLVAPMDRHDGCHCQCIELGCHTMKAFFERIWEITTGKSRTFLLQGMPIESTSVPKFAKKISTLLRGVSLELSEWDRVTKLALRYITFEALELRHTCCKMPNYEHRQSKEEIMEIEDEGREKLNLLELLLQDFQIAYRNFEIQDGQGDKFTNFLTAEWSPRMQQALADIEAVQLTAEEKLKAEEIGVRWQPVLEKEETDKLEYWLNKLDEIMPA